MANPYFQFKQFTIVQDQCAMKVSTDSCLFGAWYAEKWKNVHGTILDIGSGTGLLTLMLLQKTHANIHGVEISDSCFPQLEYNIQKSPWQHRTLLFHADARKVTFSDRYDFIISNPPFHENQLKSRDSDRDTAHHSLMFTLGDLLRISAGCITPEGKLAVLLPFYRVNDFISEAVVQGFFPEELVSVQQSPQHDYFRAMLLLSRNPSYKTEQHFISITDNSRNYSAEFISLLKDYYLKL